MRRRLAALILPAMVAACVTPTPRTAEKGFELVSFRWRAEETTQRHVVANNEWGDIRIRTTGRGGLLVSAMIQKIGTTEEELEVCIYEGADRVSVEVVPRVAAPRGRVDLTLMIPPGKSLEVTTLDGLAEIKYKGNIVVRTRGDDIIGTTAHSRPHIQSGHISAGLSGQTCSVAS